MRTAEATRRKKNFPVPAFPPLAAPPPARQPTPRVPRVKEELPVTDVPRLRRPGEDAGHLVHQRVGNHDLHLDLREEVHRVFAASVQLRVSFLTAESAHLGYRHSDDSDSCEGLFDVVELERLDDRPDLFYMTSRRGG